MKTPITYYGGKQKLASAIISMMPRHKAYVEPYFGGGTVFFAKHPSPVEVINDHDRRIMTFYRQVVENFEALQERIQNTLCTEAEWLKARRYYYGHGKKEDISDLEIAWSVWVLTNMSYSGSMNCGWKWDNTGDTVHSLKSKRLTFTEKLRDRLSLVQISQRDAITVIEQRDTEDTFFSLDPPYLGAQMQHYRGFSENDLDILLTTLSLCKGKFILSHFSNRLIEAAVSKNNWNVKVIDAPLSVAHHLQLKAKRKRELLIYNYDIEPSLFDRTDI